MRTLEDSDYLFRKNLTGQQIEFLNALLDGEWRDRKYLRQKIGMKKLIPSIISERIIKPLESRGIVEQEERPIKKGAKKTKKFIRIRKDIDERSLHRLIMYSANDLGRKYPEKDSKEKGNFYFKICNKSIKKLEELEDQDEKRRKKEKEAYWRGKEGSIPYSENWPTLIVAAKQIADMFEKELKQLSGIPSRPYQVKLEEILRRLPHTAFLVASATCPELFEKIKRECKKYEWKKYYGIDLEQWERG